LTSSTALAKTFTRAGFEICALNHSELNLQDVIFDWQTLSPQQASLHLKGRLHTNSIAHVWSAIEKLQGAWLAKNPVVQKELTVQASDLDYVDIAGVSFLIDLERTQLLQGASIKIVGLDEKYQALLDRFKPIEDLYPVPKKTLGMGFITAVGRATAMLLKDSAAFVEFIGQVTAGFGWVLRRPGELRWQDVISAATQAGLLALPIISLVAFLIGVILTFQSAVGLAQYGASTYVAPLVSKGIFRELGPLITAILFAGRSAAAFAAEIGTMTVNNEVDALTTAGINPIRFLVMPRVLAGVLVVPLLTIFANVISVAAVILTMVLYQIPIITSLNGLMQFIVLDDIYLGVIKAVIFGIVIAGIGCLRGMQTGTGAAAVGISTTQAVVSSIVMIVLIDGIFAVISYRTGF
jgi:phospholipid/cholesterol/gamma-HCH transport system permease protein